MLYFVFDTDIVMLSDLALRLSDVGVVVGRPPSQE